MSHQDLKTIFSWDYVDQFPKFSDAIDHMQHRILEDCPMVSKQTALDDAYEILRDHYIPENKEAA